MNTTPIKIISRAIQAPNFLCGLINKECRAAVTGNLTRVQNCTEAALVCLSSWIYNEFDKKNRHEWAKKNPMLLVLLLKILISLQNVFFVIYDIDVVETHPGLDFLDSMENFQLKYGTVAYNI